MSRIEILLFQVSRTTFITFFGVSYVINRNKLNVFFSRYLWKKMFIWHFRQCRHFKHVTHILNSGSPADSRKQDANISISARLFTISSKLMRISQITASTIIDLLKLQQSLFDFESINFLLETSEPR